MRPNKIRPSPPQQIPGRYAAWRVSCGTCREIKQASGFNETESCEESTPRKISNSMKNRRTTGARRKKSRRRSEEHCRMLSATRDLKAAMPRLELDKARTWSEAVHTVDAVLVMTARCSSRERAQRSACASTSTLRPARLNVRRVWRQQHSTPPRKAAKPTQQGTQKIKERLQS